MVRNMLLLFGFCLLMPVRQYGQIPSIYLIGDSTMADKDSTTDYNPERGWGQMLHKFFSAEVVIENHAVNGRSSKSFRAEGRWQKVLDKIKPGDFVFIQFGHNDQKVKDPKRYTNPTGSYYHNLKRYVEETREKGATPVLLTSIVRRKFNAEGTLVDTHGLYPLMVRQLSRDLDVLFIDHLYKTEELVNQLGAKKSKEIYLWVKPGVFGRFPDGKEDDTHLSPEGATTYARLAVEELITFNTPLNAFITLP